MKAKELCECGHTKGQHYRIKYQGRQSETGCSRCSCFEFKEAVEGESAVPCRK